MFQHSGRTIDLSESDRARIAQGANLAGLADLKWGRHGLDLTVAGSAANPRRRLGSESLARALRGMGGRARPLEVALALCRELSLAPPPEALSDWEDVRPLIVPRLVHPRELSGPRRAMCRREAFGGLLLGGTLGAEANAPFITTAILDRWPLDFELVIAAGLDNLAEWSGPEVVTEVKGAGGVLAVTGTLWPASSGALVLDVLCPDADIQNGVVFAVPDRDTLLMLPVSGKSGVEGLAALVQLTHSIHAQADDGLSDQMFWARADEVIDLPVTMVEEESSRRVHLEAKGRIAELLRALGADEG